ncbi:MAG: inositol monophosphatase family protein [Novosphingobium sp.]|uniref:inositol monophosphatase family protein n=1 Tax=Novosphingobium sp. NDB2Meth1 TaxID=1892847 RepID=UPI000B1BCC2E|nr:inositol monophosphatase family protein [Novosphingobium sp. NDB2Meth1]MBY0394549.1 inositol monophosphatase family protein [Novosphingobium sp.]
MSPSPSPSLARLTALVAEAAGMAAGARPQAIEQKSLHDFVTDMDRRLEDHLRGVLEPMFGVPVLGEESIAEDETLPARAVVVDPLDGTSNWIAGLPFAAVSVAYVENGKSLLGAVVAIGSGTVYAAEAGQGAWRDGQRLALAGTAPQSLMALSTGLLDVLDGSDGFRAVRRFGKLRNFGSQALQLCAVAQGALALNASIEARLWDDAAGRLIAAEAGAVYRAWVDPADAARPAAKQRCLAVHPAIADEAAAILTPFLRSSRS